MIVYHSSPYIVKEPDIEHSRNYLDFGKGFYVTTIREQALKYAQRFILRGKTAYLNTYELADFSKLNIKRFEQYDGEWLDFVANCRKGTDTTSYDIVIGGIANDKVFRTIDLFFAGDITKDEALSRLVYEKPNIQLCIRTRNALATKLKFVNFG